MDYWEAHGPRIGLAVQKSPYNNTLPWMVWDLVRQKPAAFAGSEESALGIKKQLEEKGYVED